MLDFLRDIYSSFRQTSLERVKSPFLGAFVFSWVGFNWQTLAILILSKKEIEERLSYINDHFDVGNFLLGPICTTVLISTLLPQINKIITRIQDKPKSDTIELNLTSKIRIAELQQSIADIDARKKLAEKKEEKYIEESIYQTKKDFEKSVEDLHIATELLEQTRNDAIELRGWLAKAESKLDVETTAKENIAKELLVEKETIKTLQRQTVELNQQLSSLKSIKYEYDSKESKLKNDIVISKQEKENITSMIEAVARTYPEIFIISENNGITSFDVKSSSKKPLLGLNKTLKEQRKNNDLTKN
ncbi:hypothetical protein ABLV17_07385 [Klebsiella sp. CN_Kp091]|uniref:hypothetical protein n=1 Tax=unclassified Klebsiella TaxID=2608929 RepID=UPI0032B3EA19